MLAVGEVKGIGGAPLAAAEGWLAGIAAARYLGGRVAADSERVRELQRARQVHARFAATIERIYSPVPVLSAATPETTLCRCEGVTLGDLRRARSLPVPADDLRAAKAELRCGMGACQGAVCTEAIAAVVGARSGDPDDRRSPRVRPPVMPVSVGALPAFPRSTGKWQATSEDSMSAEGASSGASATHVPAYGGTGPGTGTRRSWIRRLAVLGLGSRAVATPGTGTAASSSSVYGCRGCEKIVSTSPISTIDGVHHRDRSQIWRITQGHGR